MGSSEILMAARKRNRQGGHFSLGTQGKKRPAGPEEPQGEDTSTKGGEENGGVASDEPALSWGLVHVCSCTVPLCHKNESLHYVALSLPWVNGDRECQDLSRRLAAPQEL